MIARIMCTASDVDFGFGDEFVSFVFIFTDFSVLMSAFNVTAIRL